MMLAASAVLFGSFLLSSLYLQNVLGTGALETGLAFLPFAAALGAGVHVGTHVITHAGVRVPLAGGLAVAAAGMLLLSGVDAHGSYAADVLPGMLVAGLGLGVVLVARLGLRAHRRRRRGDRDALGPEHHRPRDRRLARHRGARHGRDRRRRAPARRRGRARRRHRRRVPRRRRSSPASRASLALAILPSARSFLPKLRSPRASPSTRPMPAHTDTRPDPPPRRRRAQRRPHPRRRRRRAGERSRGQHGRDRSPRRRRAGDDLRALPHPRGADRSRHATARSPR